MSLGVILGLLGFMLFGILLTVEVVDAGMPGCLAVFSCIGLMVGGIGISSSCSVC